MLCGFCISKEQILRACEITIALFHPHVPPPSKNMLLPFYKKSFLGQKMQGGGEPFSSVSRTAWHLLMHLLLSICFSDKASLPYSRERLLAFSQHTGAGALSHHLLASKDHLLRNGGLQKDVWLGTSQYLLII